MLCKQIEAEGEALSSATINLARYCICACGISIAMDAAVETPTKRDRKINFVDAELRVLFYKYAASAELLNGTFSATLTHKRTNGIWTEIAEAVSACGFALRSSLVSERNGRTSSEAASKSQPISSGQKPEVDQPSHLRGILRP